MPRCGQFMLAGLLVVAGGVAAENVRVPLQVNPFIQPERSEEIAADTMPPDTGSLELRGIMLAGQRSLANIGGRIVGIGQEINGYRLVDVNGDGVVLEREGTRRVLEVRKQDGVGNDTQVNASR